MATTLVEKWSVSKNEFAPTLEKMVAVGKRAIEQGFKDVSIAGWKLSQFVPHVEQWIPKLRNSKASNRKAIALRAMLYMLLNDSFRETLCPDLEGIWLEFEN